MPGFASGNIHFSVFDACSLHFGKGLDAVMHVVQSLLFGRIQVFIGFFACLFGDNKIVHSATGVDISETLGNLQEFLGIYSSVVCISNDQFAENCFGLFQGLWVYGVLNLKGNLRWGDLLENSTCIRSCSRHFECLKLITGVQKRISCRLSIFSWNLSIGEGEC